MAARSVLLADRGSFDQLLPPITGKKRAQVWKKLKKIVKAVELWNFGTGTLEHIEFWNLITSWNSGY